MVRRTTLLAFVVVAVSQLSVGCCGWRPFQWNCGAGCWPNTYTPPGGGPLLHEPILNRPILNRPLLGGAAYAGQPAMGGGPVVSGPVVGEPMMMGGAGYGMPGCSTCNSSPSLSGPVGVPVVPYGQPFQTTFGMPTTTLGTPTIITAPGGTPMPMAPGGTAGAATGGTSGTAGGNK